MIASWPENLFPFLSCIPDYVTYFESEILPALCRGYTEHILKHNNVVNLIEKYLHRNFFDYFLSENSSFQIFTECKDIYRVCDWNARRFYTFDSEPSLWPHNYALLLSILENIIGCPSQKLHNLVTGIL